MSTSSEPVVNVSVADVVSFLRIEGGFSEALGQVVRRRLLLAAADEAGIKASPDELQRAADVYRATHGLHRAADTESWMKSNGITLDVFEKHLEENIRISKMRDRIAETDGAKAAASAPARALIRDIAVEAWLAQQLAT
jgi:hypothetical protein